MLKTLGHWFMCWVLGEHRHTEFVEYLWGGKVVRCKHCDILLHDYE